MEGRAQHSEFMGRFYKKFNTRSFVQVRHRTYHHAARVASSSALKHAGTSKTRAQRDPVSSLKSMEVSNPSRQERRAGGKRRWAFGDRSRAAGQSPKGGWSLQIPLAHKEKGPARDLFSGLQFASGGDEGIRTLDTVSGMRP